ncbi:cytochrome P450 9e2-like [Colletes gigas]|uniref:cytochrome P450 9e2-like n=1 Tax=Colletes gigas TaxID=935657 RepID=UPI001C9AF001|nr:cytochrome P450 9e2-like [Colletes gigas]
MWATILALLLVVLSIWYYLTRQYNYFEKRGIPYPKQLTQIRNMWDAIVKQKPVTDLVEEIYNVHHEAIYVGFYDFMRPVITIRDIELVKSITVKYFEHFQDHQGFQDLQDEPLFSKNLFGLCGDRWREIRTLLSPAFTSSKMKSMFKLMLECADQYGNFMATLPEDKRTLELKDTFTRYTNDVIATCAFGVSVNSITDRNNKFYEYGRESTNFGRLAMLKIAMFRCVPFLVKMFGIKLVSRRVEDFFKDLVESTIKYRDDNNVVRPDMIQLMMETRGKLGPGKELTIDDMTAQAFTFFFGGFESTSALMCFAAYEVGVNPDVQKRLQEEIDQVLENCKGEVTYDAINGLKYLDAVIYEALRIYPVIVVADRRCTKAFELPPALPGLKPYVIQKDEYLWIPIYGIQHDPAYFKEPKKFNPDRFLPDAKVVLNSGTFLSFGMGPRMCIGNRFALLETKVLLFNIFARCNLKPCSKTCIPMKLMQKGFALTSKEGFWFDIEPRKDAKLVGSVCNSSASC